MRAAGALAPVLLLVAGSMMWPKLGQLRRWWRRLYSDDRPPSAHDRDPLAREFHEKAWIAGHQ